MQRNVWMFGVAGGRRHSGGAESRNAAAQQKPRESAQAPRREPPPHNTRSWVQREDVSCSIGNVIYTDPCASKWKEMRKGDSITIRPGRAKCDQWVELYAPYPWHFTFDDSPHNVAKAIRDLEIAYPCHGPDRSRTALFSDENGDPYSHEMYVKNLKDALTRLYGEKVASMYTWHS